MENNVNEFIEEMDHKIIALENYQKDNQYDDSIKSKITELTEDVIEFLNNVKNQAKSLFQEAKDSEQMQETVASLNAKSQEVYDEVKEKIESIIENPEISNQFDTIKSQLSETTKKATDMVDGALIKLRSNEDFMSTVDKVDETANEWMSKAKDSLDEFTSREDVSRKIDGAKSATIDMSQKAADAIRNLLSKEGE